MADGNISSIQLPDGGIYNVKDNTSGFITGMTILSYGTSTWNDFITAYNANKVVYCRASSDSNPASGSQTRLAFMAYVNNASSPTEVEFQYYRSVSSHSDSQQGDQVFVYKITSAGTWSVTTRDAFTKIVAGGDLSSSYASGTLTISADIPTVPTNVSAFTNDAGYLTSEVNSNWVNGSQTGSVRTINSQVENSDYTIGQYAVAEGTGTKAGGQGAHAEGGGTTASGNFSHAEGSSTVARGEASHVEGKKYSSSFTLRDVSYTTGANGIASHSEGYDTSANQYGSHAEGYNTVANNSYTHAEGYLTLASGERSHAENNYTVASGSYSHAEGSDSTASGEASHAEGVSTIASGSKAHVEGYQTTASGGCAHAEGAYTVASGSDSHAEGDSTIANHLAQHVFGQYNIADTSTATTDKRGNYIEIVGNGTSSARSNARTLDWSGNEVLAGKLTVGVVGTNSMDVATIGQLPTKVSDLTNDSGYITGYIETDPVFLASAAYGISASDISNWNGKSDFSGSYNDLTNKPTIPDAVSITRKTTTGTNIADITIGNTTTQLYAPGSGTQVQLVRW